MPPHQAGEWVALRRDRLAHSDQQPLHAEDLLQLLVVGVSKIWFSSSSMRSSKAARIGKKLSTRPSMTRYSRSEGLSMGFGAVPVAAPDLGERGTVVVVDRDQEALGVEAVHLDKLVVVGRRSVDDDEEEVVIVVELRALVEVLRILDASGWNRKTSRRISKSATVRLVEIEPEEAVTGEEALDGGAVEVNLFRTVVVDHVTGRRARSICARFRSSGAGARPRPPPDRAVSRLTLHESTAEGVVTRVSTYDGSR